MGKKSGKMTARPRRISWWVLLSVGVRIKSVRSFCSFWQIVTPARRATKCDVFIFGGASAAAGAQRLLRAPEARALWAERRRRENVRSPAGVNSKTKKENQARSAFCRRAAPAASAEGASIAGRAPQARGCSITRRGTLLYRTSEDGSKRSERSEGRLRSPVGG